MNSIRSKPALAASVVLLLAYYFATRLSLYMHSADSALASAVLNFLRRGFRNHPLHWLLVESGTLIAGILGLVLFGLAMLGRDLFARLRAAPLLLRRGSWRPVIWVFLLGTYASTVISILMLAVSHDPFGRNDTWLLQLIFWLGYVSPLAGLYCTARLLLGRNSWWADKWIGYAGAAAALFAVAWYGVIFLGMGEQMPIVGVLGAGGIRSLSNVIYLAFGCAAAWADLTLARKGEAAMLGAPPSPALIYPLLGGFMLSGFLTKFGAFGFVLSSVPTQYLAPYLCVLAGCAGTALLCLIDGALLIAPADGARRAADDMPARTGLLSRMRAGLWSARFWTDLIISFVITCVLIGISYGTVGRIPILAAAFLMPLIIFGFLIGPIAMFVIGMLRGRPGFALAPVLILLALNGYRYVNLQTAARHAQAAVQEAASLNVYPFAEPTRKHDMVVIEDSLPSGQSGMCSLPCQQILITSDYAVALPDAKSAQWQVYRLASDLDLCRQPDQAPSYLTMLAAGRVDTCIVMTHEPPRPDALVIRENQSDDAPVRKLLPKGLHAAVPEFYERIGGQDRLLGRVVSGSVQPPLMSGQDPAVTPIRISGFKFYAVALKLPIGDFLPKTDANMDKVVASLEALFPDPTFGKWARDTFRHVGGLAKSAATVQPVQAAILRFWQSNDPELVKLGLQSLNSIRKLGLDFAKPGVAAALASDDPVVMKAAVSSLYAFEGDLEFAKAPLADLILSERVAAYGDDTRSLTDVLPTVPGGFATDARARAKDELAARPDLSGGRLLAVLAIVARGDERSRQEAVDWIFGLQGEDFERVMSAIAFGYDALGARIKVDFWSKAELEELVKRGPTVSDKGLIAYVGALQFQIKGRESRPQLKELLEERAAKLENGSAEDQKLAKKMRHAAKGVRDY